MRIAALVLLAAAMGCATTAEMKEMDERTAYLENRMTFLFRDALRNRKLEPEECQKYTDVGMQCGVNEAGRCMCALHPDATDIRNAKFDAAVKKATEEAAEAAAEE